MQKCVRDVGKTTGGTTPKLNETNSFARAVKENIPTLLAAKIVGINNPDGQINHEMGFSK